MTISIFIPNPDDVAYELQKAAFKYKNDRSTDWAFSEESLPLGDKPFMPTCYKYVVNRRQVPPLDEVGKHVVSTLIEWKKYSNDDRVAIRTRARKMVMDFYRELHTMGLLALKFGSVSYQGGLDLRFNVDYVVTPKKYMTEFQAVPQSELGVAAAMEHPRQWRNPEANDILIKKRRRKKRNCKEWDGDLFWLTNSTRPFDRSINGVWLFGIKHIYDLIDDINGYYSKSNDSANDNGLGIDIQPELL